MISSLEKDFTFTFCSKESKSTLTVPVTIPLPQSIIDLTARLIAAHNLPCFIEHDLRKALDEFVAIETRKLYDDNAEAAIERVKSGQVDIDHLVDHWTNAFTQEVKVFARPEEVSEEQRFTAVYHTLIHSPALETLLNLEHTYALAVEEVIEQRENTIAVLEKRQRKDMEVAVQNAGTTYTDDQINQLAQRQFENMEMTETKWASEQSVLKDNQKREYKDWVRKVHEDTQTTIGTPTYVQRVRAMSNFLPTAEDDERQAHITRMEESFTIILGAQMKTTHNIRLLCSDPLDLCRHKPNTIGGVVIPQPQRLQTAMSLYSNALCGLILLVDNRLNFYSGLKRSFAKICELSTDFHFPDLDHQFLLIEQEVQKANEWRQQKKLSEEGDKISIKSSGSGSSDVQDNLHTGDVYVTRHSNLSEAHVVFHLVSDDGVRSGDITSRHSVILSIRNILKVCFRFDVHTITIPLLLTHQMTEEMTIPWCLKRAELVFKCVKGFMIEMATWGGQESRTIQFLVPRALSEEMFAQISTMLPSIFRLSNPLVMKSGQ